MSDATNNKIFAALVGLVFVVIYMNHSRVRLVENLRGAELTEADYAKRWRNVGKVYKPTDATDPWEIVPLKQLIADDKAVFEGDFDHGKYEVSHYTMKFEINDPYIPVGDVALPWNKPTIDKFPNLIDLVDVVLIKNNSEYCEILTKDQWKWAGDDHNSGDNHDWSVVVVPNTIPDHTVLGCRYTTEFKKLSNFTYAAPKTSLLKAISTYSKAPFSEDVFIWSDKDTGFYWSFSWLSKTTSYGGSYWMSTHRHSDGSDKKGYNVDSFKLYEIVPAATTPPPPPPSSTTPQPGTTTVTDVESGWGVPCADLPGINGGCQALGTTDFCLKSCPLSSRSASPATTGGSTTGGSTTPPATTGGSTIPPATTGGSTTPPATTGGSTTPPTSGTDRDCEGSWGNWGTCSETCGGGKQTRTYRITKTKLGDGDSCPRDHRETAERVCNEAECESDDEDDLTWLWVTIGVVFVVLMIVVVVLAKRNKRQSGGRYMGNMRRHQFGRGIFT
jgi:hypothetical protein